MSDARAPQPTDAQRARVAATALEHDTVSVKMRPDGLCRVEGRTVGRLTKVYLLDMGGLPASVAELDVPQEVDMPISLDLLRQLLGDDEVDLSIESAQQYAREANRDEFPSAYLAGSLRGPLLRRLQGLDSPSSAGLVA